MFQCKICTNQLPDYDMNIYCKECRNRIKREQKELEEKREVKEADAFKKLKKLFNF